MKSVLISVNIKNIPVFQKINSETNHRGILHKFTEAQNKNGQIG